MAVNATDLFLAPPTEHRVGDRELGELCEGVEFVRGVEESNELTSRRGPMIVLSASGMLTGGRVLHHVRQVARPTIATRS
jgi:metallo-beta-lactamase family protein